jgi:hypothetical protein
VKTFGWTLASLNTTQAKKLLKLEKLEVFWVEATSQGKKAVESTTLITLSLWLILRKLVTSCKLGTFEVFGVTNFLKISQSDEVTEVALWGLWACYAPLVTSWPLRTICTMTEQASMYATDLPKQDSMLPEAASKRDQHSPPSTLSPPLLKLAPAPSSPGYNCSPGSWTSTPSCDFETVYFLYG